MAARAVRFGLAGCLMVALGATAMAVEFPKFGKKDPKVRQASTTTKTNWSAAAAEVDGEVITREELADELIATYGKKHIELMINRKIVDQACRGKKIEITRKDLEADLQSTLKKLNLKRSEFIERVLGSKEPPMTLSQYMRDVVWPGLRLKALVIDQVKVTPDDLSKAFEANFGERVDVRMLVVLELRKIQGLWEEVNKITDPKLRLQKFEEICKTFSVDRATQAFGGRCQPISRHSGFAEIEKLAFDLKANDLSVIIQLPDQSYVMLYCVERIPARKDITLDSIADEKTKSTWRQVFTKDLMEKKTRYEVARCFVDLQKKAKTKDFVNLLYNVDDLKLAEPQVKTANLKEPANKPAGSEVQRETNVVPADK